MVDVSQSVIVREIDCGTTDGLWVSEIHEGKEKIESFRERLIGRFAVGDVVNPITGKVIVPEGKMIDLYDANEIEAAGITRLKIRSLLTCRQRPASAHAATVPIWPTVSRSVWASLSALSLQSPSASPVPS
jgi:DNA-directed RNA polymerase subunit beta'